MLPLRRGCFNLSVDTKLVPTSFSEFARIYAYQALVFYHAWRYLRHIFTIKIFTIKLFFINLI